jgi:hypothetical protein
MLQIKSINLYINYKGVFRLSVKITIQLINNQLVKIIMKFNF